MKGEIKIMAKQNSKTNKEETRKMKRGTAITDFLTKEDVDLIDKLDNMYESEISEEIYEKCNEPEFFQKSKKKFGI